MKLILLRSASLITGAIAVWPSLAAAADNKPDPGKFTKTGKLTPEQMQVYYLHAANATFAALDTNMNGKIDPGEVEALIKKTEADAHTIAGDRKDIAEHEAREQGYDLSKPILVDDFRRLVVIPPPSTYTPESFRLRAKVSDFSTPLEKDKTPNGVLTLPSATLSLAQDYDKHTATWTASGAIGGYWEFGDQLHLSSGLEFNRMDTNDPKKKDVDSLIARALLSGGTETGSGLVRSLAWSGGLDYATNFNLDGGMLGTSGDLEAIWDTRFSRGIGSVWGVSRGKSASNSLAANFRTLLHAETGTEVSDLPDSTGGSSYLRVGPDLSLKVWPGGTDFPLSLTASYGYHAGLLGEDRDYRNFKAGAEWRIDEYGHFVLKAEYVDGMTPLLLQHQQTLLLSLGARF